MQRDIKFRAFDNKAKKWLLGYEYENLGGFSMFGECMLFGQWGDIVGDYLLPQDDKKEEDLILMQFTGLKDKNGKEIYEGDILNITQDSIIGVVEWNNDLSLFELNCVVDHNDCTTTIYSKQENGFNINREIIGNIYENPELLC